MSQDTPAPGEWLRRAPQILATAPRVLRLVWDSHHGYALGVVALTLLQGLYPVVNLWISKQVIDLAAHAFMTHTAPDPATIRPLIIIAALAVLANNVLEPTLVLVQTQLGDRLSHEIQARVLAKANSFADIAPFEDPAFYDQLQRAAGSESTYRPMNALGALASMLRTLVQLASMVAVVASFQPWLLLVVLAMAAPQLAQQLTSQVQTWAVNNYSVPEVRRMRYFGEVLTGRDAAKEVRLFNLGDFFYGCFLEQWRAFHDRFRALRFRHWRWETGASLATWLGGAAVYGYFVLLALERRISVGGLSFYSQAIWQAQNCLANLTRQASDFYADLLYVGQLFEFLDAAPTMAVKPPEQALSVAVPLRHGIEFRDVSFTYPGTERAILDHFNLAIAPGESVALVGENGAGKTTIVKLLTRLYDPTAGRILVDGVDLRDLDLEDWRRQIGAIFQDYSRYHLPARANIGLGNLPQLDDLPAIERAADRGGATAVIEQLEDGYDTVLGRYISITSRSRTALKEGAELSGGQWQKIALARAFMRIPDETEDERRRTNEEGGGSSFVLGLSSAPSGAQLLILDEPTAALDPQAEYDVYLRFHELTRGRATLLISHRFSTVKMASKIVVLEHGQIVEQGSHADLMALGGIYADLYEKQASRYR